MLTDTNIEALLINEELADQVWEAWDAGETENETAGIAWMLIAGRSVDRSGQRSEVES